MNKMIIAAAAALLAMAGCDENALTAGQTDTTPGKIAPGTYVWSTNAGCGTLAWKVNGGNPSYTWDDGCDESVDYRAQSVTLKGNVLHIDAATMVIETSGPNGFEGQWTLFDFTSHAVFEEAG